MFWRFFFSFSFVLFFLLFHWFLGIFFCFLEFGRLLQQVSTNFSGLPAILGLSMVSEVGAAISDCPRALLKEEGRRWQERGHHVPDMHHFSHDVAARVINYG